jgi:hypothetical protein
MQAGKKEGQSYEKTTHRLPVRYLTAKYHRSYCSAKSRVTAMLKREGAQTVKLDALSLNGPR